MAVCWRCCRMWNSALSSLLAALSTAQLGFACSHLVGFVCHHQEGAELSAGQWVLRSPSITCLAGFSSLNWSFVRVSSFWW